MRWGGFTAAGRVSMVVECVLIGPFQWLLRHGCQTIVCYFQRTANWTRIPTTAISGPGLLSTDSQFRLAAADALLKVEFPSQPTATSLDDHRKYSGILIGARSIVLVASALHCRMMFRVLTCVRTLLKTNWKRRTKCQTKRNALFTRFPDRGFCGTVVDRHGRSSSSSSTRHRSCSTSKSKRCSHVHLRDRHRDEQ